MPFGLSSSDGSVGRGFSALAALVFLTGLGGEVVWAMDCPHHRASSVQEGSGEPGADPTPGAADPASPVHHGPPTPAHGSHEPATHDHEGPCTCIGPCTVATGVTPPPPSRAGPDAVVVHPEAVGPSPAIRVLVDPGTLPFMHPYPIPPPSRMA